MTEAEFWQRTPAELELLYRAMLEREQRIRDIADYSQAHLAWILAEVNRDRKKRFTPFRVEEFLLWTRPESASRNGHVAVPSTVDEERAQQQEWLSQFKALEAQAQQSGSTFFTFSVSEDT